MQFLYGLDYVLASKSLVKGRIGGPEACMNTVPRAKKISADKLRMTFEAQPCFEAKNAEKIFQLFNVSDCKGYVKQRSILSSSGQSKEHFDIFM